MWELGTFPMLIDSGYNDNNMVNIDVFISQIYE